MDDDDDCTMWTVGSFCDPRLTPYEVFELTDVMAGPSHEVANVIKMIVDLGLGDGHYHVARTPAEARDYMLASATNRFAFGAAVDGVVGHMVNAYRADDELLFLDFQQWPHPRPVDPPQDPGWVYTIFPVDHVD